MHRALRAVIAAATVVTVTVSLPAVAQAQTEEQAGTETAGMTLEEVNEASATPAEGRENLEPEEEGFNDNNIDNDAGVNWTPTADPESEVIPGEMRSDSEEIPGGFTKEEADRAEVQEAEEQATENRVGAMATPTNCRTYWPSPFKVCGEIRKKYDALGGPASFLTWPRSDEKGVPDGVGRRNEFVNGFIYWHPSTGAHPITTHFSLAYDRNGWEAGGLGYPTSDEFATPNGIGRKQEFSNGAIYGSPAGLAAVEGRIYDRYVAAGASDGVMGFPTTDEQTASDGQGRFNRFIGGMIYWHPTHGAHPIRGDILATWEDAGYEAGRYGYPVEDEEPDGDTKYTQRFEHGSIQGSNIADIVLTPYLPDMPNFNPADYVPLGNKDREGGSGLPPFAACGPATEPTKIIKTWNYVTLGTPDDFMNANEITLRCGTERAGYRHIHKNHPEWEVEARIEPLPTDELIDMAITKTLTAPEHSYRTLRATAERDGKFCATGQIFLYNRVRGIPVKELNPTVVLAEYGHHIITAIPGDNCKPERDN